MVLDTKGGLDTPLSFRAGWWGISINGEEAVVAYKMQGISTYELSLMDLFINAYLSNQPGAFVP